MQFEVTDATISVITMKTVILFILTYYSNYKILNKKINLKIKDNIIILFTGIISGIIKYETNYIISTIILIIIVSIIFSENNIVNNIFTTIISLSINYAIELISIIICFEIGTIINFNSNYIELGVITTLHIILIYSLFKINRLKYGISILKNKKSGEDTDLFILNISAILLFLIIVITNSDNMMASIISMEAIIYAIIMFITIKKSLNLYYKQKMLVKELEETKVELDKNKKELKELETENLTFKKRSHSLIHKQKALEYKIQQMMMQTEISEEQAGEVKEKLEKIGEEIYKEKENIELDETGITEIDDMLKYMQSECNKNKIEFMLKIEGNIKQMTNNAVAKEDLEILLADHIKNAIIAVNHTENINRTIMVRLGKIDSIYGINIYDSGAEFERETLDNLGKKPSTTHSD